MCATRYPSHPLLLDHPLSDALVDRGFNQPGGDPFFTSIALAVVGYRAAVVVDLAVELGERPVALLQDRVPRPASVFELRLGSLKFEKQVRERFSGTEHVAMPEEPLGTLELTKDFVFADERVGAASAMV